MKRLHSIVITAIALAVLLPAALPAQEYVTIVRRGMLGIVPEVVTTPNTRQLRVVEVIKDSPAEKAGVVAGDTIVRINGLAASLQVMNAPLEPGDTVVLRVRRDGRERDVRVVATARGGAFSARTHYMLPDTVMGRISIIMDAMKAQLDTVHMPSIRLRQGDSVWVFGGAQDSAWVRRMGDSIRVFRPGIDSIGAWVRRMGDSTRVFHFGSDSAARMFLRTIPGGELEFGGTFRLDSMRTHILRAVEMMPGAVDSLFMGAERSGRDRVFRFGTGSDTMTFARPAEIFTSGMSIGMRAVAGAELSELNPGLSEYFGTTSGVLVLNARDGTPAARAGLRAGDVILRANGTEVKTIADLRRAIDARGGNADIRLQVQRRGERVDVTMSRD